MTEITHTVTVYTYGDGELLNTTPYGFTNRDDAWSFFKQEEEYAIEEFHTMPRHIDGQTFTYNYGGIGSRIVELEDIALEASKQRYEDSLKENGIELDWD